MQHFRALELKQSLADMKPPSTPTLRQAIVSLDFRRTRPHHGLAVRQEKANEEVLGGFFDALETMQTEFHFRDCFMYVVAH